MFYKNFLSSRIIVKPMLKLMSKSGSFVNLLFLYLLKNVIFLLVEFILMQLAHDENCLNPFKDREMNLYFFNVAKDVGPDGSVADR